MQAIGGQLAGRHVVTDSAGRRRVCQQGLYQARQVPVGMTDVLASVQQRGQVGAVRLTVVHQGVGPQDGLQPPPWASGLVPNLGEVREVTADLALVPGEQHRFDVGEVLVQCRAADAGPAAIFDIVTEASPCPTTSFAVASMAASRTAWRCSSTVLVHSFGIRHLIRHDAIDTDCIVDDRVSR